jgi:hypothetical protein
MPRTCFFLLAFCLLAATAARAEVRTVTTSHTCLVGDSETKNDVRRACFLEAKRKAVEQAGTYVESLTEVKDFALSSDQVRSFAAAVVTVEDVTEKFAVQGENLAVTVTVRAKVDQDAAKSRLAAAARDPKVLDDLARSGRTARDLEDRALALQGSIRTADPDRAAVLRGEQRAVLNSLEDAYAERERIMANIKATGNLARTAVRPGMTMEEVAKLLGPARSVKQNRNLPAAYTCANYGTVWVVFKDGLAECMRESLVYKERWRGDCHCGGITLDGMLVQ